MNDGQKPEMLTGGILTASALALTLEKHSGYGSDSGSETSVPIVSAREKMARLRRLRFKMLNSGKFCTAPLPAPGPEKLLALAPSPALALAPT